MGNVINIKEILKDKFDFKNSEVMERYTLAQVMKIIRAGKEQRRELKKTLNEISSDSYVEKRVRYYMLPPIKLSIERSFDKLHKEMKLTPGVSRRFLGEDIEGNGIEVYGVKFFSPYSCYESFILGDSDDKYKTRLGDKRYLRIAAYLYINVIPDIMSGKDRHRNSYGIKHQVENAIGGYVSNETVKYIMAMFKVPHIETSTEYPINIDYSVYK